ncbi:hypothetical protein U8527_07250 [Kordia algicida OT-1]|uniref:Uncharacterized protein n=1 Tax=Kordia algicida OT-1 TaxID=391587 RepID=A9EA56_9FLAO|nr:hypothetical protein [Kordia algicida]EDP94741.1 hypothetical protein KAOT1_00655 [Kordia algicida OT-1]
MKSTQNTWWIVGGGALVLSGVGAFFYFKTKGSNTQGYSIASTQSNIGNGIKINTSTTASVKQEPNWNKPFNMNYMEDVKKWVAPKNIIVFSASTAEGLVKTLHNAKGTFNDDEYAVRDVFKQLQSKTDVASLSKAYYINHNQKDLWQHLNSFLSHSEMKLYVWKYINRLPNYKLS